MEHKVYDIVPSSIVELSATPGKCLDIRQFQNKLSDQEGLNQWMKKRLFMSPDFSGTDCIKDYYLEKMRQLLTKCKNVGAKVK